MNRGHVEKLVTAYRRAFAAYPWYENLSKEQVIERWQCYLAQKDSQGLVYFNDNADIDLGGAVWWDCPSQEVLLSQQGEILLDTYKKNFFPRKIIWERGIIVDPSFQNKGIASLIRSRFIFEIEQWEVNSVIFTRMRADNFGIMRIAEKLGFYRTGIKMPSSLNPSTFHEYWYRIVG